VKPYWQSASRETSSSATLSTTIPTENFLGSNTGQGCEKPTTNRPNWGTAPLYLSIWPFDHWLVLLQNNMWTLCSRGVAQGTWFMVCSAKARRSERYTYMSQTQWCSADFSRLSRLYVTSSLHSKNGTKPTFVQLLWNTKFGARVMRLEATFVQRRVKGRLSHPVYTTTSKNVQ
jgi:hypothetical protein